MTEPVQQEAVLGSGAGGPLTAPSPWVQYAGYINYAGGVTIGSVANQGNGTLNAASIFINGVVVNPSSYLPYSGGTMTGILTLAADPTATLQAATKRYVDNNISNINTAISGYLPLAGGTMTGLLTLSADPTSNLQATTKEYVDNKFSGLIAIPDAPSDGTTYGRLNGAWSNVIDVGTY
jgi:hypothetical protein